MNWLDVFCFTSVARTKSFSVTAQELMISQQAVSRHIKALEDELGFPLFLRNFQSIHLSQAGEQMLQYFAQRDTLLEDFKKTISTQTDDSVLRVAWNQWLGCPSSFRLVLDHFQTEHPDVTMLTYDLDHREMRSALEGGRIDLLLTTRYAVPFLPVLCRTEPFSEEPILWLSANRLTPDQLAGRVHLADHAGEPEDSMIRARVHRLYERLGLRPGPIEVYSEMGSVCLNLLLRPGVSFGMEKPALSESPDIQQIPTGLTASTVLCVPLHGGQTLADELMEMAKEASR